MLFMVVERFKDRNPRPIYQRLRDKGRSMPEGLTYVASWVEANWERCWQVMECDDPRLFQEWLLSAGDLVEFEIVPVVASKDVQELMKKFV